MSVMALFVFLPGMESARGDISIPSDGVSGGGGLSTYEQISYDYPPYNPPVSNAAQSFYDSPTGSNSYSGGATLGKYVDSNSVPEEYSSANMAFGLTQTPGSGWEMNGSENAEAFANSPEGGADLPTDFRQVQSGGSLGVSFTVEPGTSEYFTISGTLSFTGTGGVPNPISGFPDFSGGYGEGSGDNSVSISGTTLGGVAGTAANVGAFEPAANATYQLVKPQWWAPSVSLDGTVMQVMLPELNVLRKVSSALCVRALLRAQQGDFDGFLADVVTAKRLDRRAFGWTAIGHLVANHIDELADQAVGVTAGAGIFSSDQCANLARALDGMEPMPPLWEVSDVGER
jgi:hypothetical protein